MRIISRSLSSLVLVGLVASGCGGEGGSEVSGDGNGRGAPSSTGGLSSGNPGSGNDGLGGNGVVISPDDACATGTANASVAGVNRLVLFDRSTSMNGHALTPSASPARTTTT